MGKHTLHWFPADLLLTTLCSRIKPTSSLAFFSSACLFSNSEEFMYLSIVWYCMSEKRARDRKASVRWLSSLVS